MPRLPSDFAPTEPGSVVDYTIDMTQQVPTGVTITSAPWTLSVRYVAPGATIDPSPQSRVSGNPTISGSSVIQRISGLHAGNTYLVTMTATLSDGEIVILWCTLPCQAPS